MSGPASGGSGAGGSPDEPVGHALRERIAQDPYGRWLGIELLDLRPGYCRAALTLTPGMATR